MGLGLLPRRPQAGSANLVLVLVPGDGNGHRRTATTGSLCAIRRSAGCGCSPLYWSASGTGSSTRPVSRSFQRVVWVFC